MRTEPNWVSPPGATIARVIKTREIDSSEFANAMGLKANEFEALLDGKLRLNNRLAEALAEQLGSTARFWLARDKDYLKELARLGAADVTAIDQWAQSMPVSSMRRFGWLPLDNRTKAARNNALLAFFDCKSIQEWGQRYSAGVGAVAFRTSLTFASDGMATLVWLRAGESQLLPSPRAYDREEFRRILPSLKRLSAFKRPANILSRLREACAMVGVSIATARAPDGCRASGASWFDAGGCPVIHLSFRHLSEDHFWFTFFHEAAHIVLHGHPHIDGDGVEVMGAETETQEDEANSYAQDILLPDDIRQDLLDRQALNAKAIMRAAKDAKVTAGVIVGQLEKADAIPHGKFSFLKHRYRWGTNSHIPELIAN